MQLAFTFNDSITERSILSPQLVSSRYTCADLVAVSFPPVFAINSELNTGVFKTSADTTTLTNYSPSSLVDLVAFLNSTGPSAATWSVSYGVITMTHTSSVTITDNGFSRLILGCTDFTTSATTHTFSYAVLFPFSSYVLLSNALVGTGEMDSSRYYVASFPMKHYDFFDGGVYNIDRQSYLNGADVDRSFDAASLGAVLMTFGVRMNDGSVKRVETRHTRPLTVKIALSAEPEY